MKICSSVQLLHAQCKVGGWMDGLGEINRCSLGLQTCLKSMDKNHIICTWIIGHMLYYRHLVSAQKAD
jgi:hypothetical protein